jgi:hypothetical protein
LLTAPALRAEADRRNLLNGTRLQRGDSRHGPIGTPSAFALRRERVLPIRSALAMGEVVQRVGSVFLLADGSFRETMKRRAGFFRACGIIAIERRLLSAILVA